MRFSNRIKQLTSWPFTRSPMCYGASYLLLMLVLFPCIYSFRPTEFYHSTLIHEAALRGDGEAILQGLQAAIVEYCRPRKQNLEGGWIMDLENIALSDVRCDQGRLMFLLTVRMDDAEGHGNVRAFTHVTVGPEPDQTLRTDSRYVVVDFSPDKFAPAKHSTPSFDFHSLFSVGLERPRGQRLLLISPELAERISDYIHAHEGRPGRTSGGLCDRFLRMLYLSVVTQTTVGFGDIVPITTTTRAFVTLQAVLGVVLIGLFLNALANQMTASKADRTKP